MEDNYKIGNITINDINRINKNRNIVVKHIDLENDAVNIIKDYVLQNANNRYKITLEDIADYLNSIDYWDRYLPKLVRFIAKVFNLNTDANFKALKALDFVKQCKFINFCLSVLDVNPKYVEYDRIKTIYDKDFYKFNDDDREYINGEYDSQLDNAFKKSFKRKYNDIAIKESTITPSDMKNILANTLKSKRD